MSENVKRVAERLKELRLINNMTTLQASQSFNLDESEYVKYENGERDIPVSFLYETAQFFGIELIELLSGDAPKLHVYQHVKKGKGLPVDRSQQYQYQNLACNFAHKKAEPFLVSVEPTDKPISTNSHPGQEFNYCLDGKLQIRVNDHDFTLSEGDCVYYDSSYPHGMKALDGKTAKFLAIIM